MLKRSDPDLTIGDSPIELEKIYTIPKYRFATLAARFDGSSGRLIGNPLNRTLNQLAGVFQGQLLFNVGLVRLDRLHTDMKFFRDLAGSAALADQPENFKLAIRQVGDGRALLLPAPRPRIDEASGSPSGR